MQGIELKEAVLAYYQSGGALFYLNKIPQALTGSMAIVIEDLQRPKVIWKVTPTGFYLTSALRKYEWSSTAIWDLSDMLVDSFITNLDHSFTNEST